MVNANILIILFIVFLFKAQNKYKEMLNTLMESYGTGENIGGANCLQLHMTWKV